MQRKKEFYCLMCIWIERDTATEIICKEYPSGIPKGYYTVNAKCPYYVDVDVMKKNRYLTLQERWAIVWRGFFCYKR